MGRWRQVINLGKGINLYNNSGGYPGGFLILINLFNTWDSLSFAACADIIEKEMGYFIDFLSLPSHIKYGVIALTFTPGHKSKLMYYFWDRIAATS